MIWGFVGVNVMGAKAYERTLIPMMFVMFALGGIVIVAGFSFDQADFAAALLERESRTVTDAASSFDIATFLAAAAILFASFIGFDAIAQAGGEAKNPGRNLPVCHRHRHRHGGFVLLPVHRRRVPRRAVALCRGRSTQQRHHGARTDELPVVARLGRRDHPWCRHRADQRPARHVAVRLPADVRLGRRRHLSALDRPRAPGTPYATDGDSPERRNGEHRHTGQPFRGRLLFRHRHHGDLDAGQLPADVR